MTSHRGQGRTHACHETRRHVSYVISKTAELKGRRRRLNHGDLASLHGLTNTSAFGTCIQKYIIERYVCLIVFMVIAQTHVQAVATVH